ncbi:MAG: DUF3102 domain-containing protein [Proteobacteria bacterium]|nr:DUF3102 domain-containing protein [Pseudomonadota bacterium]
MTTITTPATAADNSLGSPPAAVPNLEAIEPSATVSPSPAIASLARDIDEARANQHRGKDVHAMVELGRRLLQLKAVLPHGQFAKVVIEQIGLDDRVARRMMRAARLVGSEHFLSLKMSKSALAALLSLGDDTLNALADGQTVRGYALQDFRAMTVKQVREAVRAIKREDTAPAGEVGATSAILRPGDRVESLHAGRLGEVVKVYADASACIRWDDGEPQEAGLGHERMPRELLKKVDGAKVAPAAAPAAVEVEEIEVHAVPPDPADTPPTPAVRPSMAEREAYCEALFGLLFGHADDAALDELCDTMEAMLDTMASRRPRSALAQAWGDLFARFAVQGGV